MHALQVSQQMLPVLLPCTSESLPLLQLLPVQLPPVRHLPVRLPPVFQTLPASEPAPAESPVLVHHLFSAPYFPVPLPQNLHHIHSHRQLLPMLTPSVLQVPAASLLLPDGCHIFPAEAASVAYTSS